MSPTRTGAAHHNGVSSTAQQMKFKYSCSPSSSLVLAAKTSAGLHEFAVSRLVRFVDEPSSILDLGAGTGAWAEKLIGLGHRVTCVDRNVIDFGTNKASCVEADLNGDFSNALSGKYRVVTALEVIEHLENPRHFLRECSKVLQERGIVLLTTPNIECVPGRLRFLLTGQFRMFDRDVELNDPTHITPIQTHMFEKIVQDTGYRVLLHDTKTRSANSSTPLSRLLCALAAPFVTGFTGGDNHLFVLSKERVGF